MKSYGGYWQEVVSFGNLYRAMKNAASGARRTGEVTRFICDAEMELLRLKADLVSGEYRPGKYRVFWIKDPKERLISAAPFRDRVVHHAVCDVLEPVLERIYTDNSYACRKNRGTHAAVDKARQFLCGNSFFLKCDIRKFFNSVDHECLKNCVAERFREKHLRQLLFTVTDNPVPGCDTGKGIAIGNLTSQHFANLILTKFDLFVVHSLKPSGYIRYMDDFVLFDDSLTRLQGFHFEIADYLSEAMKLELKKEASFTASAHHGLPFLGMRIHRGVILLNGKSKKRILRKLALRISQYDNGFIERNEFERSLNSIFGHLMGADTYRLREKLLGFHPELLEETTA